MACASWDWQVIGLLHTQVRHRLTVMSSLYFVLFGFTSSLQAQHQAGVELEAPRALAEAGNLLQRQEHVWNSHKHKTQ